MTTAAGKAGVTRCDSVLFQIQWSERSALNEPSTGTNNDTDTTGAYLATSLEIGDPLFPIRRCSLGAITLVIHMAPHRQRRVMAAQPKCRIPRK